MKFVASKKIRMLRAEMEIKAITLRELSTLSGIPYTTCSGILNGRIHHPDRLEVICSAITKAPTPEDVAIAY